MVLKKSKRVMVAETAKQGMVVEKAKRAIVLLALVPALLGVCSPVYAAEPGVSATQNRPIRDKWALVIGISDFENSKLNLRYSAKDASDFANYLTHEGGFAADHVKVLLNKDATKRNILSDIGDKWLPHLANPDDLVVIFLSTHGSGSDLDLGGQNYLVAYDTDVTELYATGIPMQQLAHDIKNRVHCDRVIIFLDACHSGATEPGARGLERVGVDANEFSAGSGQMVIASSKDDQVSWESKKLSNGVFTAALLDALKNEGGSASVGQLFSTLKENVQDTVLRERGFLQTPVLKSQWSGSDIVIAAKPTSPHPGLVDATNFSSIASANIQQPASDSEQRVTTTKPSTTSSVATARHSSASAQLPSVTHSSATASGSSVTAPHLSVTASHPPDAPEPVNKRILLVPGKSVARMKLGMGTSELVQLLGKPTVSRDNVITYWTSDHQYFLSVLSKDNQVQEVAFSSPAFKTESGINLGNFETHKDKFVTSRGTNGDTVFTLSSGGLKFSENPTSKNAIGIVYPLGTASIASSWWSADDQANSAPATMPTAVPVAVLKVAKIETKEPPKDVKGSATASHFNTPKTVDPDTLVVPGTQLAKIKLGESREQILQLLGKPTEETGNHLTYWTKDHKTFLAITVQNGTVQEVVFSSKMFATADGIGTTTFDSAQNLFRFSVVRPAGANGAQIYVTKDGGLAFVKRNDGKAFGWLYTKGAPVTALPWNPMQ